MAKAKTVSKADLVNKVVEDTGMRKKDVKTVVDSMVDQISTHLNDDYKVQLTGFGTFEVRERKARTGVKPGTTDRIDIPASKYPAFKPGKDLKERVMTTGGLKGGGTADPTLGGPKGSGTVDPKRGGGNKKNR